VIKHSKEGKMAKGISGEEACEEAKSFVWQEYGPMTGLQCSTTERRGKVWVVIVEGGFPIHRKFKIHVNAETGKIGFNKEIESSL